MKPLPFALTLLAAGVLTSAAFAFLHTSPADDTRGQLTGTEDPKPKAEEDEDDEVEREKLVRHMFEQMDMAKTMKQSMDGMLEIMKGQGLPEDFLDAFGKRIDIDELVDLVVPVYVQEYDGSTLRATIAFYDTDAGKKLLAKLGKVTLESQKIGAEWGQKLAMEVMSELESK